MNGDWRRLDKRAVPVAAVTMVGVAFLAGVPSAIGLSGISVGVALAWVLPGAVVVIAAGAGAAWLDWRFTRYQVGAERVEVRSGVLIRNRRSLQRDRIRTVDVTADPLQRVFGVVTVRIGTGEHSKGGTVQLRPVARATGDELRRVLLARVSTSVPADGRLATFDLGWIRYAPLSFLAPALGAAAVGGLFNVADWFGRVEGLVGWAIDLLAGLGLIGAIAVLVAVTLLIGTIGALGFWIEMWWAYRLDREAGGTLRVRRGLFTTRSISVEEERLRGVDVVEALGTRLAGAARVDAVATGLPTTVEDNKADQRTLLPAVPRALADRVAADVLREEVSPTAAVVLSPHPIAARGRRVRWALATVLAGELPLIVLGVLLTEVLLHVAWITAALALPIALVLAVDAYRSLGHGRVGGYLVTRSGTIRRSTVALQRRGIIGWTVRQSAFQRRAGLATVWATTAAGAGAYAIRDVGAETGLAAADAAVPGLLTPFLAPLPDSRPVTDETVAESTAAGEA
ncbi:PH domain-containing protein [Actinoplanes bogorensis]|uniref:PH domain-containing protein n=1 Tax=Paractinoplanes bogorensis TaxID=1610840 RepID=A0ABS5YSK7_9ACTN|nr:PH domain-containing protein [Actinoplanes bogorensis]MBU2666301.1 PH domain-containing protein [Actinoplanes bogorensis]